MGAAALCPSCTAYAAEGTGPVWKAAATLRGHREDVQDLAWAPDGSALLTGSVENESMVFDVEARKTLVRGAGLARGSSTAAAGHCMPPRSQRDTAALAPAARHHWPGLLPSPAISKTPLHLSPAPRRRASLTTSTMCRVCHGTRWASGWSHKAVIAPAKCTHTSSRRQVRRLAGGGGAAARWSQACAPCLPAHVQGSCTDRVEAVRGPSPHGMWQACLT